MPSRADRPHGRAPRPADQPVGHPAAAPTLLDGLLSADGWPHASAPPTGVGDPGRYHALFGRDSLIVALQLLPERPELAAATLRALAALQGRRDDPRTDEEPGKIAHEHWPRAPERLVRTGWPVGDDGSLLYYGSADSTSWFLVVLAALGDAALSAQLEPSWRAAGEWLERALERGGGLIRHGPRRHPGGLHQQGWRDATHPLDPDAHGGGILREDGSVPESPLADADTQAVAVVATRSLARLSGDARHRDLAKSLRERVARAFAAPDAIAAPDAVAAPDRLATPAGEPSAASRAAPDRLPDTLAVEADGRRVRGAGSYLGWLLWAGAAPAGAAERLVQPDVLTPWGLRTLAEGHPQFHPHAYHRGSVWPFDSWLGWSGLRAAGRHDEAERLRAGVLDALDRLGGAPELYAVGPDGPERIAIANAVQAWTIGARWALENGWDAPVAGRER